MWRISIGKKTPSLKRFDLFVNPSMRKPKECPTKSAPIGTTLKLKRLFESSGLQKQLASPNRAN